jgi:hypothetical protein
VRCFACLSAHCLCPDACASKVVCLRCISSWTCAQHNHVLCRLNIACSKLANEAQVEAFLIGSNFLALLNSH